MNDVVIQVEGLTKRFGDVCAVDDITMSIRRGQVHGFVGPNGSGKTTTIRMMCGLMVPTAGSVTVLDMSVRDKASIVRRHVGYMTQRFSLYEDMTVRENMLFLCRVHGLDRHRRRRRIGEVLERYGLVDLADRRVGPMSGGQKRRIALGAAVLTEPKLLLLDEPTSEVDPNTRREMWGHFFDLASSGTTLLVTTHLMDEAERCHRLTIMDEGRVVADGEVDELKRSLPTTVLSVSGNHVTPFVARIAQVDGVVAVNQVGQTLRVLTGSPETQDAIAEILTPDMAVQPVAPTIEDVFVSATSKGGEA